MMNPNVEETQPHNLGETNEIPVETAARKNKRWPYILLGLGIVILGLIAGGLSGYQSGIDLRRQAAVAAVSNEAAGQYQMALEDEAFGRIETAIRRMEYVLQLDPSFPGGREKLTELMIAQQLTSTPPTPTPAPTATLAPTPDTRSEEELFSQARQSMANKDWATAVDTLDRLRDSNVDFHPVDVDGMYYVSLRYRGVDKILVEGNLESGIYDITLAERIGPLDAEADNYRKWARMYLTAASYWEIDWGRAVALFSDIAPSLPGLRDTSGMTATERLRMALAGYGDWYARQEKWCEAEQQYNQSLLYAEDAAVRGKLDEVTRKCHPPEPTAPPAVATTAPVDTTPTGETPTTPTEETPQPTEETPQPTVEPTTGG